jgi:hypothetical protein
VPSVVKHVSIIFLTTPVYEIDFSFFVAEESLTHTFNKDLISFLRSLGVLRNSNGTALLNTTEIECTVSYKSSCIFFLFVFCVVQSDIIVLNFF